MLYEYGKRTRDFFEAFLFFLKFSLLYFWGVFNKTIIPLALVGYIYLIRRCIFLRVVQLCDKNYCSVQYVIYASHQIEAIVYLRQCHKRRERVKGCKGQNFR